MERFEAEIELSGKTATGIRVPEEVVEQLGSGKRPPVKVTVGGHTYRSTIAPYRGGFFLPLSRANREAAAVEAGEVVDVVVELDLDPREVEVPQDLAQALAAAPEAGKHFDGLSYTHQREYVEWITDAKRDETRARRIGQTVEMLTEGSSR